MSSYLCLRHYVFFSRKHPAYLHNQKHKYKEALWGKAPCSAWYTSGISQFFTTKICQKSLGTKYVQCTLIIVNAWIVNNLSLVNIFGETGRFFYNINYMLNSEHLSLVNKIGDKTEFTITRVRCTVWNLNQLLIQNFHRQLCT